MTKKKVSNATQRIRDEQKVKRTLYETLQSELHMLAFVAMKQVITEEKKTHGVMSCILCGSNLNFAIAKTNRHLTISCTRQGCIKAME